ncbi:MAG: argininosuccinate lyase [Xanthomonadaceae bacterium]|nr:argininosuccinate lyase [Xanthomonadaceae bacterium]
MGILGNDRNPHKEVKLFQFTQGIEVDRRLYLQEIRVQTEWARGLMEMGILTSDEFKKVCDGLEVATELIESGKFEWKVTDEDIHMNLERFITEKYGDLGKKMHLGRSRNDLIATTLKLYVSDSLEKASHRLQNTISALVNLAERDLDVLIPGMTHVQHGQPIRLAQFYLAHAAALARDVAEFERLAERTLYEMPLGSGALSGTPLKINLEKIAEHLGFHSPALNSYDQVGNRDEIIQALASFSLTAIHVSRLSEDLIYYSSTAVGLFKLPQDYSTGSSMMPNKRNPDVPELSRAKMTHVMGAHNEATLLMKALPTAYASDLHELKSVFMRAESELTQVLEILPLFLEGLKTNESRAKQLLGQGHILATEMADELTLNQKKPFRDAYNQVAGAVELAESQGVQLHELTHSMSDPYAAAVERRTQPGGTSRAQCLKQIEILKN